MKVIVIHVSIRTNSTYQWMNTLVDYLRKNGFEAEWVEWSGIPLKRFVKAASKRLLASCQHEDPRELIIIAKSVGADVANLVQDSKPARLVIAVAPAFVVSKEVRNSENWAWIQLIEDRFIRLWKMLRVVRTISPPNEKRLYEIEDLKSLNHHIINENVEITIKGLGAIRMYDLYLYIIRGMQGSP